MKESSVITKNSLFLMDECVLYVLEIRKKVSSLPL